MEFEFSQHVKDRIEERQISEKVLKDVLVNPQQQISGDQGEIIFQSKVKISGKTYLIRAAVFEDRQPSLVATAYRTSKINKYWKE